MSDNNNYPWFKLFTDEFASALLSISNNMRLNIFCHLLCNLDFNNHFTGTARKVANAVNTTERTVQSTFKVMFAKDVMRKVQNGVYMINPTLLAKGDDNKRGRLILYYNTLTAPKIEISTQKIPELEDDLF
jgi:hypothetical protein